MNILIFRDISMKIGSVELHGSGKMIDLFRPCTGRFAALSVAFGHNPTTCD